MKTIFILVLVIFGTMAVTGAQETRADDTIFKAEAGMSMSTSSREVPDEALVYGTVTLSGKGEIKIHWDGVTVGLGDYTVGSTASRTFASANLPSLYLDLQKIFGVKWMDAIRLKFSGGAIDNDPITGKSDITLGQISVNLTQTVTKTKTFEWTMNESAGMAGYFQRKLYNTATPFEAVPVCFALNTKLVAKISSEAVVAISMGAFSNIVTGINQNTGFRAFVIGGYVAPSVTFGGHLEIGGRVQAMDMVQVAGGTSSAVAYNVSGYVKYMLSQKASKLQHAIELSVGAMDDGIITDINGNHTRAKFAGIKYTVAF